MADYITTYTKIHMTPLEPKAEQIAIVDIAHALSMMTRANGHFPEFHSVAQHCIECAVEAIARNADHKVILACLLHDASEAYLSDITRPVKKNLLQYHIIEENLQNEIYRKFLGDILTEEEQKEVTTIDDTLLYYEFYHYAGEKLMEREPEILSQPVFRFEPFKEVEQRYLELFAQYYK